VLEHRSDSICGKKTIYSQKFLKNIIHRQIYAKETVRKPPIDLSYLTNLRIALRLNFAIMQKDITWLYCMSQQRKKGYQSLPARAGSHCQQVGQQ
jgi:hypothetical protein